MAMNWMLARDAKSPSWVARKQIPARLRPAYSATFGKGWAEVEGLIHFVTASLRGDGGDLSHIQAHALAGRWYRWKVARP